MVEGTPILVPEIGTAAVSFGLWLVGEGESVSEGDRVAELLIPGACVDLVAPASGELKHLAATGDHLKPGDSVGVVS